VMVGMRSCWIWLAKEHQERKAAEAMWAGRDRQPMSPWEAAVKGEGRQ
jgi:hypothetical protein